MQHNDKLNNSRAWAVLIAATGTNMAMGLNYSWSVIKKALVTDWHWTNVEASLPYTVYAVVISVVMFLGGRLQDRVGPRLVVVLGGVLMGVGLVSCSFSRSPLLTMITYGIAASGGGLCVATTMPTTVKWFPPERKGFVTGIVVGGSGLAPAYFSPIANWLLGQYDISSTFLVFGIGMSVALLIMAQFLNNPPTGYKPKSTVVPTEAAHVARYNPQDVDWRTMIKTSAFLKLWLMYFLAASAGLMIIGHIATIAKTQADWENGFYLVVLIAIFNTSGRMMGGFFSDKYGRIKILIVAFSVQVLNLALFANYTTPVLLAAGTALVGFCYGSCFALFPLMSADYFGLKNLGGNYGLLFTAWGAAALLGPLLAGWVADVTGTYSIAYQISAVLLLAALAVSFTMKQPCKLLS